MLYAVISGFIAAAFIPGLRKLIGERVTLAAALVPLCLTIWFSAQFYSVTSGLPLFANQEWVAGLNLNLAFHLDGLALLFCLLISGIGTLVVLYTHGYLKGHPHQHRFTMYTLMFMASMLGVVLADNIILLFIFWELTSFTSYLMIGFNHKEEASRKAALQALLVTGMGGLFLLAGLILAGTAAGTYSISEMLGARETLTGHTHYPMILALVLVGAFTKSAQVPFHFWLPNAMQAPTPASAYLHSSTMVKAGVYLLARLHPALGGTDAWMFYVTGFGAATLLTGAVLAAGQVYLKKLLAYTTVAALGAMVMAIGIGTEYAAKALIVFLLAHACYKAALFLVAGSIDHEAGEKNVTKLGGLFRSMPITGTAAIVAALSMAGIPLAFGFIGKELLYKVVFDHTALLVVSVVASAFFVLVAYQTGIRPFFATKQPTPKHPHETPWTMFIGPVLLAVVSLAGGLLPGLTADKLVSAAVSSVYGEAVETHLHLWHGINRELIASGITVALGLVLVFTASRWIALGGKLARLSSLGPDSGYTRALNGLTGFATFQTRFLQSGSLRRYLMIIVITTSILFVLSFLRSQPVLHIEGHTKLAWPVAVICVVIMIAAIAATRSSSRLGAVAAMGVVGFGVALIFIFFGAPDLAMTQLVIETLSVVLLVSAFYYLPPFTIRTPWKCRVRDLIVCSFAGAVMTILVLIAVGEQIQPPISSYFIENSVGKGYGRNIVNVILVDFRALDTLGEITVLAVAGIGALTLLRLRSRKKEEEL